MRDIFCKSTKLTAMTNAPESNEPPSPDEANPVRDTIEAPADAAAEQCDMTSASNATPARAIRPHGTELSKRLAAAAAQVALDNNGQDVVVLDVCAQSAEFDYFVLATGSSRRQLHAISEQIDDRLEKDLGDRRMGIEGYDESRWIVLDYGSVIVHLFDDETREYYDLESLWADGTEVPLSELGLSPNNSPE